MPANFDGTSAEPTPTPLPSSPQPKKNKEDINNRTNKENTSNEEQISEKKKNKNRTNHGLTLTANNNRKNIKRPLKEDLYIGNLTNDATEEEILALLGLDGTTHLRENTLSRRQYTDNGRFAGCIHVWIPQQFIETGSSNPTENAPGEKVWVDNVEAPVRAKALRGRIL